MKKPKTAYEKDIFFISKFLAGRTNGLHLDTADLVRAERLFMQLTSPTKKNPEGRNLYITFNTKGVFRRQYGQEDLLAVRGINLNFLDKVIEKLDPPELSKQEIEAVDAYFLAKDSYNAAVASGSADAPSPVTTEDFPEPIDLSVGEPKEAIFMPFDVSFDNLRMAKVEFFKEYQEFLIRFRYLVQGSDPSKDPQLNPKFLNADGVLDANRYPEVAEWFAILPVIGTQYGIVEDKLPAPASNKPLDQCLEMLIYSPKKASNILILEGFKEDFNSDKGEVFVDSIREFEYTLKQLENSTNQLVLLAPSIDWGSSAVSKLMSQYSLNAPDFEDVQEIVRGILASIYRTDQEFYFTILKNITQESEPTGEIFDKALVKVINSLRGLLEFQITDVVWTSIRSFQNLDPETLDSARKEIINRTPGLTVHDPDITFDQIGGLESLKTWIIERGDKLFLTKEEAEEEGSNFFKGLLLAGAPGVGKSLITKAIARYLSDNTSSYSVSLIQLDPGALRGSYVGQTEAQTRIALKTVESFAPAILWIDELEKNFAVGPGAHETSRAMLSQFLTFMQEHKSPIFIIGTVNSLESLPPEFKRKGRWDAVFYLPLPNADDVVKILDYHLSRFKIAKGKMQSVKKVISNTQDGEKKFLLWRRLAFSGNTKGQMEKVLGPTGQPIFESDSQTGAQKEIFRFAGFTGAEIESSVQMVVSRIQSKFNQLTSEDKSKISSWRNLLTIDDLIVSLKSFSPISHQTLETVPGQPKLPMSYVMYQLEQVSDKIPSDSEIEEQKKKLKDELGQIEVGQDELSQVSQLLGEIEELAKKRNPIKKNNFQNFYLLGSDFYKIFS